MTIAYNFRTDPSFWVLIASNLFSIVLALVQGWDVGEVMWVYWGQSAIIGIATILRFLSVRNLVNKDGSPAGAGSRIFAVCFFTAHYGMFHYFYMMGLRGSTPLNEIPVENMKYMLIGLVGFVATHVFSLAYNITRDFERSPANISQTLMMPYRRIIPMHVTFFFGTLFPSFAMMLFMGLKTWVDAGAHISEHKTYREGLL